LLAILPIPQIWNLKLKLRARLSLVIILSLGVFASIAGIVKQHNANQFRDPDPYIKDAYAIWNFIELDVGIIAASLPALKPLLTWLFETARGMTRPTKGSNLGNDPARGYKQNNESANIALKEHKSGPSVMISAHPYEHNAEGRHTGIAEGSQDSILSHDEWEGSQTEIMVTRQVHVS
jgi:hypothetical protein